MYNISQFKPTLYMLLLLGVCGFGIASQSAGVWVLGATGIVLNGWLVKTGRFVPMPRLVANGVTLLAVLYVIREGLGTGTTAVLVVGQFLVLLHLIKLWEQRTNRDYAQLLVLSLLLMVAASINTASLLFGVLLIAYLFLSLYCCLLFHLKVETDNARAALAIPEERVSPSTLRQDQRYLSRSMRRLTGFVAAVSITLAVGVFLFFPRGAGAGLLGPLQVRAGQPLTGFSDQMGYQKIAQIQQNDQIMAYVQVWKNDKPVRGEQTLLLRGTTLDTYAGREPWNWTRSGGHGAPEPIDRDQRKEFYSDTEGDRWRQSVHLLPTGTNALFAMPGPVSFKPRRDLEIRFRHHDSVLQTAHPLQQAFDYEVVSRGVLDPPGGSSDPLPPLQSLGRLRLSRPTAHPRIAEYARRAEVSGSDAAGPLAAQLLADRDPVGLNPPHALDAEIAAHIEQHLKSTFSYTLDLTDARKIMQGQDPMVAFLYDLKRGHCEYFAGAMVLMCQSLGMQARVATGFKCDEYNDLMDRYVVRQTHAHAWVEVRTAEGWKTFDPTSGRDAPLTTGRAGFVKKIKHLFNYLEFTYANAVIAYDNENQENLVRNVEEQMFTTMAAGAGSVNRVKRWLSSSEFDAATSKLVFALIGLILAALVISVGWFLWEKWMLRRRAARIGLESLPPSDQLRLARQLGFYDDLLQLLGRHHITRPRHLTPMEFTTSLMYLPSDAYETARRLTSLFYRVRFGRSELSPGQHRRLGTVIARLADDLTAARPVRR